MSVAINYQPFYQWLQNSPLQPWLHWLPNLVTESLSPTKHGDVPRWLEILQQLPPIPNSQWHCNLDAVTIACDPPLTAEQQQSLRLLLLHFQPWRKGPFAIFDVFIDTEWRSHWKWNRIRDAIEPLTDRLILDVGSGNGYYGWRMLGEGAKQVIGIDPTLRYIMQFAAVNHFVPRFDNVVLPLRLEQLQQPLGCFDTVFSMGVLYHQRNQQQHLRQLADHLRPGGQLVLEGLVTQGEYGDMLIPQKRYAKMHNVYCVPTPKIASSWLAECGYRDIRIVDVSATSLEEQRKTEWMPFESLADFLDPNDSSKTFEGYSAPVRAVWVATKR